MGGAAGGLAARRHVSEMREGDARRHARRQLGRPGLRRRHRQIMIIIDFVGSMFAGHLITLRP